ncbi:MAG: PH domain-containing protein, partial [Candidatus Saccharibacteria bacterium]
SVIQEIQLSLFSKNEQTVSLANIEDASYIQENFIQQLFDYGSIRLSTEGDETTYRFNYVASPKQHIAKLNNAVEAFKNGRPVEDN